MANLKLFHINKIYDGGVHAVKDFTLDINDKEFVVFVGPSGCGKSTVLRMIAGLEKISTGDLYIGDRVVNALPPKERNISMVFQSYALFPNMSVYDNISYGLRMHGEDKEVIREKVTSVAEMLNLTDYLYRKPTQLSGGQRQRVALGRAIVRHPDVFLLDEPLSNLDAKLRNKMRNEIMALHRKLGATFIYVTHDQVEAMTMGDKIVAMRDGTIMQIGSPTTLYQHPANMFVAGFIGSPQMNFWEGSISLENGLFAVSPVGVFPLKDELALRLDESARVEGKRIVIGMRPEDISVTRKRDTDIEISANISVVENFCAYSVYHGDWEGIEIVGQDKLDSNIQGQTVKLYVDVSNIHIFDAETEMSLLPEFAPHKEVSATKSGNKLSLLGGEITLPEWQAASVADGCLKVRIPFDAISEGNIPVVCRDVLDTSSGAVSLLNFNGEELYALGDYSGVTGVGLNLSAVEIFGDQHIQSIPKEFTIPFTYVKERGSDGDKTVLKHYCDFGNGMRIEAFYEFNKKMYHLGRKVFRTQYDLHLGINNLRPATENESYPCINGRVEQILDYGDAQYSKISVGNSEVFVRGALPLNTETTLAVDLDNARVSEVNSKTILF